MWLSLSAWGADHAVVIDSSNAAHHLTVAVSERFMADNPQALVEVQMTGLDTGFQHLVSGDAPLIDAARPITSDEQGKAAKTGVAFVELVVAYDGIVVAVHRDCTFVDYLTLPELKRLCEAGSTLRTWKQIRASWPDRPVTLFVPGRDSTCAAFAAEAVGSRARGLRSDAVAHDDAGERMRSLSVTGGGIGIFNFALLRERTSALRVVPLDLGHGVVEPKPASIHNGAWQPFVRPLFLYINRNALARADIETFVQFYLGCAQTIALDQGFLPLADGVAGMVKKRLAARITGTAFPDDHSSGTLTERLGIASGALPSLATQPPESVPRTDTPVPVSAPAALPAPATAIAATAPVPPIAAPPAPSLPPALPAPVAATPSTPTPSTAATPPPSTSDLLRGIPAQDPSEAPTQPVRPATLRADSVTGDPYVAGLGQAGDSSLALARLSFDSTASVDDVERESRRLAADLAKLQSALPDRRLQEAAQLAGVDAWREAAMKLIRLRGADADPATLITAARVAIDDAMRDQMAAIQAAKTPGDVEATRARGVALRRFITAVQRWRDDVTAPADRTRQPAATRGTAENP